jgi:hypothetical protein
LEFRVGEAPHPLGCILRKDSIVHETAQAGLEALAREEVFGFRLAPPLACSMCPGVRALAESGQAPPPRALEMRRLPASVLTY